MKPEKRRAGRCVKCGRKLTDPYSLAVGMGPECRGAARKAGARFPKPRYAVRGGRVVFAGVTGKVELPTVDAAALPKAEKEGSDAGEQ